ncbi:MAG: MBL fold metallo-hydrolase [Gemmatimonadaceae bacterium]
MAAAKHHRPGGGFRNPWPDGTPQGFLAFLKWNLIDRLLKSLPSDPPLGTFTRVRPSFQNPRAHADDLTITWVGHSTTLLQVGGLNVLTDPIWSYRASPIPFLGPWRWVDAAIEFEFLPPIDLILVSHNHYDHLDDRTVRRLAKRFPEARWVAPLGVSQFLRKRAAVRVDELDWWQQADSPEVSVTCVPAQHFSARGLGDRNRTLWCGWCVRAPKRNIFFAGDTGYHPDFTEIGRKCGPFDAALIPIGAYEPRWFMKAMHMNPEEAVQAFQDICSGSGSSDGRTRVIVPIHWGTFKLTDEPMDEPPKRARAAWLAAGLSQEDFWLLHHGETRRLGSGESGVGSR